VITWFGLNLQADKQNQTHETKDKWNTHSQRLLKYKRSRLGYFKVTSRVHSKFMVSYYFID
jgi:hypothetical protein